MKKAIYILSCLFLVCLHGSAQNTSIIDELNQNRAGQGKITIYQDDAIKRLVGTSIARNTPNDDLILSQLDNTVTNTAKSFIRAKGFRIQVYSGNNQRLSKNEAESRRDAILSSFPNMEVNVTFNSPVWRVKAGNFRTQEQASEALNELKNRFPSFGREMYIVSDVVKLPVE